MHLLYIDSPLVNVSSKEALRAHRTDKGDPACIRIPNFRGCFVLAFGRSRESFRRREKREQAPSSIVVCARICSYVVDQQRCTLSSDRSLSLCLPLCVSACTNSAVRCPPRAHSPTHHGQQILPGRHTISRQPLRLPLLVSRVERVGEQGSPSAHSWHAAASSTLSGAQAARAHLAAAKGEWRALDGLPVVFWWRLRWLLAAARCRCLGCCWLLSRPWLHVCLLLVHAAALVCCYPFPSLPLLHYHCCTICCTGASTRLRLDVSSQRASGRRPATRRAAAVARIRP